MRSLCLWMGLVSVLGFFNSCSENINAPVVEDQEFFVDENAPAGTIVGAVIAFDLDEGQTVSFQLRDVDDDGTFEIDNIGGHLSVADPLKLDYELQTQILLSVLVADDHPKDPMESIAFITVQLIDLNEFAPVIEDQEFEIDENPAKGELVGVIQASDPEEHQGLSFSIVSGNEEQVFALDAETGSLTVNDPVAFNFDLIQQFIITVKVRDIHLDSKTDTASITVEVIDI